MKNYHPQARRQARYAIVQALYQWQISNNKIADIEAQFTPEDLKKRKADADYFYLLLSAIIAECDALDADLIVACARPLNEVNPVELAILRLGAYELKGCLEIPYRVVINEALELAKLFATPDAAKFINGALDALAKQFRVHEK